MEPARETYDEQRARWARERQEQLDRSRPYEPGPYRPGGYSVGQRDTHHFDVYADRRPGYVQWYYETQNLHGIAYPMADGLRERAFAIRGEPGDIYIRDERWDKERPTPRASVKGFHTVAEAMAWIHAELVAGDEA